MAILKFLKYGSYLVAAFVVALIVLWTVGQFFISDEMQATMDEGARRACSGPSVVLEALRCDLPADEISWSARVLRRGVWILLIGWTLFVIWIDRRSDDRE